MKPNSSLQIAAFVTPHGFGHASRASALLAEIRRQRPEVGIEIFTTVPQWFFAESLPGPFGYHRFVTDVGLVQKSPLEEDLDRTIEVLEDFLPFDAAQSAPICSILKKKRCNLVLCDISPLGIAAAERCAIPSVLVENFTWDWIYSGYISADPRFAEPAAYLEKIYKKADLHIGTEPYCRGSFPPESLVDPIPRKRRIPKPEIRKRLDAGSDRRIVLVTMGGIEARLSFPEQLKARKDLFFIIPGGGTETVSGEGMRAENLLLLPHRSKYFHPDLIHAADAVVGKAGYSTIAEVWAAGVPFGYVPRDGFPETDCLIDYITENLPGMAISARCFETGEWIEKTDPLLSLGPEPPKERDGATEAALRIFDFIGV